MIGKELLQFGIAHIAGVSMFILGLIMSLLMIGKYRIRTHERAELACAAWWLVVALIMGVKFL